MNEKRGQQRGGCKSLLKDLKEKTLTESGHTVGFSYYTTAFIAHIYTIEGNLV